MPVMFLVVSVLKHHNLDENCGKIHVIKNLKDSTVLCYVSDRQT